MLTDDSAGEQCAVRKAFRGLIDGEQEVTHLLCKVHSQRTIDKKLKGPAFTTTRKHLAAALYHRRTRAGCEESIQAALRAVPRSRYNYLEKGWWKTRADWANYARCHSSLLLQVPSTNSVESWHSSLKYGVKASMSKWSLCGLIQHISNAAHQWDLKSEKRRAEFRTKFLSDTAHFPQMRRLPYPVQRLCVEQLKVAHGYSAEDRDPKPLEDEIRCDCLFFRQYQLPCADLYLQHWTFGNVLTDEAWERFVFMWDDQGFEIYETMQPTYIERDIYEEIGAPARRRLEVC
jgi:hypothetical protein